MSHPSITKTAPVTEAAPVAASKLMDKEEVMAFFHCSLATVDRAVKEGWLRPVELPFPVRRVLFARSDVEALLEAR